MTELRKYASLDRLGTLVTASLLALLVLAYWCTDATRCMALPWLEHVRAVFALAGLEHPSDAALATFCERVHSFAHACLFLSGGPSGHSNDVWTELPTLWFSSDKVMYERDVRDVLFAITWGMALFVLRGISMQLFLRPLAQVLIKQPLRFKISEAEYQRKLEK